MLKRRIGKDLVLKFKVTTNGQEVSLEGRDLTLIVEDALGYKVEQEFEVVDQYYVQFEFSHETYHTLGNYSLTLWEDYEGLRTCVDKRLFLTLVQYTTEENDPSGGIDIEEEIQLEASDIREAGGGGGNSASIADAWAPGKSYQIGDVVMKGGMRYVCLVNNNDDSWGTNSWKAENLQIGMESLFRLPKVVKTTDYLYEATYNDIDYAFAKDALDVHKPQPGGCTACVSNGLFGRNYDWLYSNNVSVVVRTPRDNGRYASFGVASGVPGLTESYMNDRKQSGLLRLLPFLMLDGENEHGVFISENVVPRDKGQNTGTTAAVEERISLNALMVPRYVLDRFTSADSAIAYLRDYVSLYLPTTLTGMDYEVHWMIGDSNNTYYAEIVEGELVYGLTDTLTNFHLNGVGLLSGGLVYTNADVPNHLPTSIGITPHGSGLERWNIVKAALSSVSTKAGMRSLMNSLLFTTAYTEGDWYSEFTSIEQNVTVDTPAESAKMTLAVQRAQYEYERRDRNNSKTWQTQHSCVYDLSEKKLYVVAQEDTAHEWEFLMG